jgi:O-antigen ligase
MTGDTLLEVDGEPVRNAEEVVNLISSPVKGPIATVKMYRGDVYPPLLVPRNKLLPGATAEERLGIANWHIGRDWRASGFYGHYVTYAESLQLIASLALGLFICLPLKKSRTGALLLFALAAIIFALLLTLTRASWLAFLVSAGTMFLLSASRRMIWIAFACAIPLIIAGALLLQQKRHVGLIDNQDASTTWRETVWREGAHLLVSNPRHMGLGVGMDSIKRHWREWGLFDNGNIPLGHMHSNFLQIALERGLPALIVWLLLLAIYGRTLWQALRKQEAGAGGRSRNPEPASPAPLSLTSWSTLNAWLQQSNWIDRGIILGALGGLLGFLTSGLVHYNWGDSEVVMIFYFMMGLSLMVARNSENTRIGSL